MTNAGERGDTYLERHGSRGEIVFNRPHRRNALSGPLVEIAHRGIDEFVADGRLEVGRSTAWKQDTPPIEMKDGDLYTHAAGAGGGWGDPLERDRSLVLEDLHAGWLGIDTAREVYGVVFSGASGAETVDDAATDALRTAIRKRRLERGVPVKDWWKKERSRVQAGEFIEPVRAMHRECLDFERYREEFTGFWALAPEFEYCEEGSS